jgi:ABC-type uncharacterized transport system substrate-binding protein
LGESLNGCVLKFHSTAGSEPVQSSEVVMATIRTILAVAVGEIELTVSINTSPPPRYVRPYIKGLIAGLSNNGQTIGTDYTIDYRECPVDKLDTYAFKNVAADVIFCMSTRVVDHVRKKIKDPPPIVGVVSDYSKYKEGIYGFSAKRFQTALACYNAFTASVPSLQSVYVLHDKDHGPSNEALKRLPTSVQKIYIDDKDTPIPDAMTKAWDKVTVYAGILVLPVDRCFGAADAINGWGIANNAPIFWPVTDWVYSTTSANSPSALGGYGVSQEHCGEVMGGQVAAILSGNPPKKQPFVDAATYSPATTSNTDITWAVSQAVADAIEYKLGTPQGLTKR